jgi:drug/metabolite transporter (DMT)-like permease
MLLAPLILGEHLAATRIVAAIAGFFGILIVARPFGGGSLSPGIIAALACAVGFAGAALATKRLTRRVSVTAILFWLALMQTALGLALAAYDGAIALPGRSDLPWVALMGIAGIGAHLGLTKALSLAPATLVTPIDFLRLPIIAVVGMGFYDEPLDIWVLVGGAIIFGANWVNILVESRGPGGTERAE